MRTICFEIYLKKLDINILRSQCAQLTQETIPNVYYSYIIISY